MAEIVLGIGVPHGPTLPKEVLEDGPESETGQLFQEVAARLSKAEADVVVVFDSDHFVNFFFDNYPAICIPMVDEATGPDETRVEMPRYTVKLHEPMARDLFAYAMDAEFDVSSKEEMVLDHSILVPLHFLTPRMQLPIVPIYIRGLAPPLPLAKRCLALGQMVGRFIREQWPGPERVAVLASGSISLEVGGPRMGRTDHGWVHTVVHLLETGATQELVQQATTRRMLEAGNVSAELLNWIAMLGAIQGTTLRSTFLEARAGHAFAVWEPVP